MLETKTASAPSIDISVMSIYNPKMPSSFWLRIEQVAGLAVSGWGYDGLEVHPNRFISGGQLERGKFNPKVGEYIHSLHQNWTGEKSIFDVLANYNKGVFKLGVSAYTWLFLPERVSSLRNLDRIQERLGKAMPAVLFPPEGLGERSGTEILFGESSFQPTPELMTRWNVRTIDELAEQALIRGYVGKDGKPAFTVDLGHIREEGEVNFHPWQKYLPQFLKYAVAFHVPVLRYDLNLPGVDGQREARDLIQGGEDSDLAKMLDLVRQSGFTGRVVTEANPWAFSRGEWMDCMKKLASSLRQRFN